MILTYLIASWVHLGSEHFDISMDATPEAAQRLAQDFEDDYAHMQQYREFLFMGAEVRTEERLEVVVFADGQEIAKHQPDAESFFARSVDVFGPHARLVMTRETSDIGRREELARWILSTQLPRGVSPWFSDGFAAYLSTLRVVDGQLRLGEMPEDTAGNAWLMVHQLYSSAVNRDKLARFLAGQPSAKAWKRSGLADMDFLSYRAATDYAFSLPARPSVPVVLGATEALTLAHVEILEASLYDWRDDDSLDAAAAHIATAQALAPNDAEVQLWTARLAFQRDGDAKLATPILQGLLSSGDSRVVTTLVLVDEAIAPEKAIDLLSDSEESPLVLYRLAQRLPDEAVQHLSRCLELAPAFAPCQSALDAAVTQSVSALRGRVQ